MRLLALSCVAFLRARVTSFVVSSRFFLGVCDAMPILCDQRLPRMRYRGAVPLGPQELQVTCETLRNTVISEIGERYEVMTSSGCMSWWRRALWLATVSHPSPSPRQKRRSSVMNWLGSSVSTWRTAGRGREGSGPESNGGTGRCRSGAEI